MYSTIVHQSVSGGWRTRSALAGARRLATLVPAAALIMYAITLLPRAPALSSATFLNADAPAGVYLAVSLTGGPSLPVHTELLPMLVERALLALPAGHLMIQLLGPLLAAAMVGAISWTVWRLRGPWLASMVMGLAAGPILLWSVLFPTAHVFSFFTAALLAWVVVAIALGRAHRGLLVASGLAAGIAVIGDQAFVATGLGPVVVAGGALWMGRRRRRDLSSLAVVLASTTMVIVAGEFGLHVAGVRLVGNPAFGAVGVSLVPLGTGIQAAARALGQIAAGQWGGTVLAQPWSAITLLIGCAVPLVAPTALIKELRRSRDGASTDLEAGRLAYLFFWTTADVVVLAVYVVFGYALAVSSAHYLVPCFLSAVATLPFIAGARGRTVPQLGAAAIALIQAAGILWMPTADFSGKYPPSDGPRLVATIKAAGLTKGYADYWESHPLTWLSGESIHVYPVVMKGCTASQNLCHYEYSAASWYTASSGPTFLILRRSWSCVSVAPDSILGPPIRTIVADADTTVMVYGYDIATRFASPILDICPQ